LPGVFHTEDIWILSRDGTLSNPSRQNIYEKSRSIENKSSRPSIKRKKCMSGKNTTLITRESAEDLVKGTTLKAATTTTTTFPI